MKGQENNENQIPEPGESNPLNENPNSNPQEGQNENAGDEVDALSEAG